MLPCQVLMYELGVVIECSGPLPNICPCSTVHLYLFHFRKPYPSPVHLYRKDERALPGDLHSSKFSPVSPVKCSVSHYPLPFLLSLSSLSFDFKMLIHEMI
jgi:hypothetical protein